jgi:hypothetical protein
VEQPAESVAPADAPVVVSRRDGPHLGERRLLIERAVWPVRVVVGGVLAQNTDPSFGTPHGPEGLEILVIGAPNLGEDPREDVDGQRDWWAD